MSFPPALRRCGVVTALGLVALQAAYAVTLVIGLVTLPSPQAPIADPMFTLLELLIIAMAPLMVLLMVAVHGAAAEARKPAALAAVAFAAMLATVTCAVHAVILVMSRDPAWIALPWAPLLLSFRWPSISYVLDVLAWDLFFPLCAFCAAFALGGRAGTRGLQRVLVASGFVALAGLVGAALGDMTWRNVGIVGYLPLFAVAVLMLARQFARMPAT